MIKDYLIKKYEPEIRKRIFLEQFDKPNEWREYVEPSFMDSELRQYYHYPDIMKMPQARFQALLKTQKELESKIKSEDLMATIEAVKKVAYGDKLRNDKKIEEIVNIVTALEQREKLLIEPYLVMKLAAILNIREDEDPAKVDELFTDQKIEQFTSDARSGEGLHSFFQQASIYNYLPSLEQLKSDLKGYWEFWLNQTKTADTLNKMTTEILEGV